MQTDWYVNDNSVGHILFKVVSILNNTFLCNTTNLHVYAILRKEIEVNMSWIVSFVTNNWEGCLITLLQPNNVIFDLPFAIYIKQVK
jgi:hypothetical protein